MSIRQKISELLLIISSAKTNDDETLDFPIEFIFQHTLERIEWNLISLEVLMNDNLIKHEHSIGLISRNLLSDFILTGYMILESSNEDELKSKLYSTLNSDLNKMDSYNEIGRKFGKISNEDFDTIKEKYSDENSIHSIIRKFGSAITKVKVLPNSLIFQTFLKSENQNVWRQYLIKAYDLWLYFSKYEHLGWFSYEFTRKLNKVKSEQNINFVILCSTLMAASCFELLKKDQQFSESMKLYNSFNSA